MDTRVNETAGKSTGATHSNWPEVKVEVLKAWNKITDEELEKTKGDRTRVGELIGQKYGLTPDGYNKRLSDIFKNYDCKKDESMKSAKSDLHS